MGIQVAHDDKGPQGRTAQAIAAEVGIDRAYLVRILPQDKEPNYVSKVQEEGLYCGDGGDGINDAPALSTNTSRYHQSVPEQTATTSNLQTPS